MIWIVYYHTGRMDEDPVFFGAFYSEAGAQKCLEMLLEAPRANHFHYHIVAMPIRTLS